MAKCLVTGATGFIGTHLVQALAARGDDVTCLVRKRSRAQRFDGLPICWVPGDITQPESLPAAVAHCDVIYHVAGLTRAFSRRALDRVNADGTKHLMEAAAGRSTPPVFVLVSSLAAAGPACDGVPNEPQDPCRPVSNYGRSKRAGECAAIALADRVPVSILRPPIVIGEGDMLALALFRSIALFRLHLLPGLKTHRFSLIHVVDLVQGLIAAAERGRRIAPDDLATGAGIYYPADAEMPTFAEFGQLIARGFGRGGTFCLPLPRPVLWMAGALGEVIGRSLRQPVALNLDKVREATAGSWICSPRTAAHDLGFQPAAPLAERIRQACQWYLREGWV